MTNEKISNLDQLKAESRKVIFLGKEFELGYIPCGLSIPLLENHNRALKEQGDNPTTEQAFNDMVKCVSIFCSFYEKDFSEEFLKQTATNAQLNAMYQNIVQSIIDNFARAMEGVETSDSTEKKTIGKKQ